METLDILRYLHVIGAMVLFGTGAGIAFFMVMAHRTGRAEIIAHTAAVVVIADTVFTATAVVVQPITGILLALKIGWPLSEGWVAWALGLYVLVGVFWLPVVWMQVQMRNMARAAERTGESLPARYFWLFRLWFAFGFPAFFAVMAILWLMLVRPDLPAVF